MLGNGNGNCVCVCEVVRHRLVVNGPSGVRLVESKGDGKDENKKSASAKAIFHNL